MSKTPTAPSSTAIPAKPPIPDQVREASRAGELVVFVGAGVSQLVGCPLWKDFAQKTLDGLCKERMISYWLCKNLKELPPRQALSIAVDILRRAKGNLNLLTQFFEKPAIPNEEEPAAMVFDDLYAFRAAYMTTNYDEHLEEAKVRAIRDASLRGSVGQDYFSQRLLDSKVVYSLDNFDSSSFKPLDIVHIHGCVRDQESMVVTLNNYIESYGTERSRPLPSLLKKVFRERTVLFVGYGLEELEILEYVLEGVYRADARRDRQPKHVLLLGMLSQSTELRDRLAEFYGHLGVHLEPYSLSETGYDQLAEIVKDWRAKLEDEARVAPPPLETARKIDAILDSPQP